MFSWFALFACFEWFPCFVSIVQLQCFCDALCAFVFNLFFVILIVRVGVRIFPV